MEYRFGDKIRLIGFEWSDGLLRLYWQTDAQPDRDYTAFVHIVDQMGVQVAAFDSMPMGGDFPTSLWPAGALVVDEHHLDISGFPSGRYRLIIGLYSFENMERLPVLTPQGMDSDQAVEVAEFAVE